MWWLYVGGAIGSKVVVCMVVMYRRGNHVVARLDVGEVTGCKVADFSEGVYPVIPPRGGLLSRCRACT